MSRVVHFEVPTSDPTASMKFYENVFGWKFNRYEGPMDYWLISTGDPSQPGIDGGLGGAANGITGTVNTVDVDNIDVALAKVLENGGQVMMEKSEIPGVGYLAYVREPGGAVLGMMQMLPGSGM